jgi:hypothetical protein
MTSEELREMATHVQYEIDEFRKAIQGLNGIKETDADWNSTIELALLHFRNLRDFFVPENSGRGDDLFARDYIATWNPPIDQVFKDTREGINKRLAHLTLTRLLPWNAPLEKMNMAIEALVSNFEKRLIPEQATWFPRLELHKIIVLTASNYSTHSGSIGRLMR